MVRFKRTSIALGALFLLVYWMTIVGLGIGSRIVVGTIFAILFLLSAQAILNKGRGASFGKYNILLCLMAVVSLLYVGNYRDSSSFVNYVNYFVPVFYFVMFAVLFSEHDVNQSISRFFNLIFFLETAFILIEIFDGLLGFDIHGTFLTSFFLQSDDRFFIQVDTGGEALSTVLDALPIALGLHGFPHYTAPIYVVSFAFALAHAFSRASRPKSIGRFDKVRAEFQRVKGPLVLFAGIFCIYMLGVKTHFITAVMTILIVGLTVNRKILGYGAVAGVLLVGGTLFSSWALDRIENLTDQVLVGNSVEGSRIDVIFNFKEYGALLDLTPWQLVAGTGEFNDLQEFEKKGYFLEQKFLLYTLVFGIPYMILIGGFFMFGFHSCKQVYSRTRDPQTSANAIAIACSLLVYFLDLGHFGYTMITPNIQLLFVLVAAIFVMERGLKLRKPSRTPLPQNIRDFSWRSV